MNRLPQINNNPIQNNLPKPIKSLCEIIDAYNVFIFDLWGVVHNGKQSFSGAVDILTLLQKSEKHVYFLSNAPRRRQAAMDQLIERGVPRNLYHDFLTSGEDCFEHLRDRPDAFYQSLGNKLYHLGPEKDKNLYDDLEVYTVTSLNDADFVLNTGTYSFEDTLEDYVPELQLAVNRGLPMICANPDLMVLYGESEAICAGRIAKEYEKMGGLVHYHGKPDSVIYHKLLARAGMHGVSKVLMVGDSLRTDIKGANNAGIDSVFILSGIHRLSKVDDAASLYSIYDAIPTYVMERVQ
ncbi:MAG: TIGR01459 family HAD-type hydrolase [Alphaproteobacteria bacterium]|nr:TIGR01459 family HAD-type hydrolase [Alphaproteobacteria bacterium]